MFSFSLFCAICHPISPNVSHSQCGGCGCVCLYAFITFSSILKITKIVFTISKFSLHRKRWSYVASASNTTRNRTWQMFSFLIINIFFVNSQVEGTHWCSSTLYTKMDKFWEKHSKYLWYTKKKKNGKSPSPSPSECVYAFERRRWRKSERETDWKEGEAMKMFSTLISIPWGETQSAHT